MNPEFIPINPTYRKQNEAWVLQLEKVELPDDFKAVEKNVAYLPKRYNLSGLGHKHKREEIFIGIGLGLEIIWFDKSGNPRRENLNPEGQLLLIMVPSFLSHAFVNTANEYAILIEYAKETQGLEDVERVQLLSS